MTEQEKAGGDGESSNDEQTPVEGAIAGAPASKEEETAGGKPEPAGVAEEKSDAIAQPATEAQPAEEKPARPARPARAEATPPARQAPPPGGIAGLIAQALPDVHTEAYQTHTHVVVEIGRDDIAKTMPVLKNDPNLDLKFLRCLFAVDYLDEGMDVVYQLLSYTKGHEVVVKTRLPRDDLRVPTVTGVWKGADWHERETRDMFGIVFEGHQHLVPLLLPEDMTDHFPLRKDNPLAPIEEWQADAVGAGVAEDGATGAE